MPRRKQEINRLLKGFSGIRIGMQYFAESNSDDAKNDDTKKSDDDTQKQDDKKTEATDKNEPDTKTDSGETKVKSIYEQFGMSEAEIKKLIEAKKAKDEAEKDSETKLAEALIEKGKAEAKVNAMMLGAKPECVEDVISLAMAKQNEGKEFKNVIAEIKKKYPNMFTSNEDEQNKKGTGSSPSGKQKNGSKDESLGQLLGKRKTAKQKSVFFTNK